MSAGDKHNLDAMMAEVGARIARLMKRLEESDLIEVAGVVHPSGPGGSGSANKDRWGLLVGLQPWRKENGALQNSQIILRKEVSESELQVMFTSMRSYSVVRLKARVSDECAGGDTWDRPQGLLIELMESDFKDEELQQAARDLRVPRFFRDDYFGKLKLDRSVNWLEATRRRWLSKYRVCIERDGETYDARQAWEKVVAIEAQMPVLKEAIVRELFESYDTCWETLGKLTPQRFLKKIKLKSVVIATNGSAGVWFADGGLFCDHEIEVRLDRDGKVRQIGLSG
jgi:hypothetical protein